MTTYPLLPAPRARGNPNRATPPAVIHLPGPRAAIEPAPLTAQGQPDWGKLWGARILITTMAGTVAVRDDLCVGDALAALMRQPVTIIERTAVEEWRLSA